MTVPSACDKIHSAPQAGARIVIIGGGQAGAQAAISLRQAGRPAEIIMLCAEEEPPYQRPPLSKAYLKGELARDRLYLRPPAFYADQKIELRLGVRAEAIDRRAQRVETDRGEAVAYDALLIATGAPPRQLDIPGADLAGVHYLRTLNDSDALRPALKTEGRLLIIGAGYIGLEVAAAARASGRETTVIEAAPRPLARVASEPVSEFYAKLHARAGVDLRCGATVRRLHGEKGRICAAELASSETIDCAAALIGVGARPDTALAQAAGLAVDDGVLVDEGAHTDDPAIWAAGDCTNFFSPRYGRRMRLESVPNAIEQAKVAAANMAGGAAVHDSVPWFWSDQYDVKLQSAGLAEGHDARALRGDPETKSFSVWYWKDERLLAVDAINDPAAFAAAKILLQSGRAVAPEQIRDPLTELKSLIR
ncbi:MAG: FAD-dependent oxidoreductase [Parvularculaceae bacterium]